MSEAMSNAQFQQLLEHIRRHNSPLGPYRRGIPAIKYVQPNFDNRTGEWFSIKLRTMGGGEVVFHTQNECRDLPESLYERVMKYLETPNI